MPENVTPFPDADSLVANYDAGYYLCPACATRLPLAPDRQLAVEACDHCRAEVMFPKRVGPFWAFTKLGHGGRGSVYLAFHDVHRQSYYAVKVASRRGSDRLGNLQALQREAQVASDLDVHPNLVTVIAQGFDGDEYYMAMEYVSGQTLLECIEHHDGLPDVAVIQFGRQLIGALSHVMEQGYLYRDLKPENIIVGERGQVLLFDFGLALPRALAAEPIHHIVEGSPIYVPPERLLVQGEDEASEIYSLGMVLYHMAAGTPYYTAEEVYNLVRQHVSEVRMRTQRIKLARVARDLMAVISKMIKRDRQQRYQRLADVHTALEGLLAARSQAETEILFRRPSRHG